MVGSGDVNVDPLDLHVAKGRAVENNFLSRAPTRNTTGTFYYEKRSDKADTDSEPHNLSNRRRTIAPIGSLDDQIRQRKNQRQTRSNTLPERAIQHDIEGSPILARAATLQESISEESESSLSQPPSPKSSVSKHIQEDEPNATRTSESHSDLPRPISPDIQNYSQGESDMKLAFKRMRSKRNSGQSVLPTGPLKPTRQSLSVDTPHETRDRSSTTLSIQSSAEPRKRSGSFGSKILRRAKSVVTRQSKTYNVNDSGGNLQVDSSKSNRPGMLKQISLDDKRMKRVSANDYSVIKQSSVDGCFYGEDSPRGVTDVDVASLSSISSTSNILMQGDLYRRKRMAWNKTWGVLTADRLLTLYKSQKDFEMSRKGWITTNGLNSADETSRRGTFASATSLSGILSIVNLGGGCEIENVEQGRKGTTFQLIPHSYHTFLPQGVTATLPIDAEWRRTHKALHLLCKNNDEFLYWVKAFVQLNTGERSGRKTPRRNLILLTDSPASLHSEKEPSDFWDANTEDSLRRAGVIQLPERGANMDSPVRRTPESSRRGVAIQNDLLLRASQRQFNRSSNFNIKSASKSDIKLDLDAIKFIDDDEENEQSPVRIVPTMKRAESPRNIFRLTRNGKVAIPSEDDASPERKTTEEKRRVMHGPDKRKGEYESRSPEGLKRCSRTEKVDMRKAEIVAREKVSKNVEEVSPKVGLKSKYSESFQKQNGQVPARVISNGTGVARLSMATEKGRVQRDDSGAHALANRQPKTRDQSEGEKGYKEKKNLIAVHTDCDSQTIQSLQSDKRSGASSSDAEVYSRYLVAYENISSWVGSANDKYSKSIEVRENLRESNSRKSQDLISTHKNTESGKFKTIAGKEGTDTDYSTPQPYLFRKEPNSIRHHTSRLSGDHIRKQKSLRQKVLRKLGPKVSLSNSTPDLNLPEENEIQSATLDLNLEESSIAVKLRRHEAFRTDRRPSSPTPLARCRSEGDLLTGEDDLVDGNMRTFKNVRKLTQDTFIETYGVVPRRKNGKDHDNQKCRDAYDINKNDLPGFALYDDENGYLEDIESQRRSSTSESSSSEGSSYQASLTYSEPPVAVADEVQKAPLSKSKSDDLHAVSRRPRSTGSDDSGTRQTTNKESRNSWIASLTPHFARKAHKESSSTTKNSNQNTKKAVFNIPASSLSSASHRGYLDRRNKKKQWDRFWCVLQDSCLYCYNSPQSDNTQDAVVLRGYDVVADVTNLNKTKFPFRLERNGSPTLHFRSDNHREFLLWAGTLEKETRNVLPTTTDTEILANSLKSNSTKYDTTVGEDESRLSKMVDRSSKLHPYEQQKENLLREVLAHQQKIIEEQKLLQEKNANVEFTSITDYTTKRLSKDQVNDKYTKAKNDEEMKMMKCLTHLNKRRNSAQLKMDQITKELAPKSGKKRRENPHQFAEMEAKLKQLQEKLAQVDVEIHEKQNMKQDVMEKIKQRRDLEMLILEQQDSIEIIRKHNSRQKRMTFAKQTQPQDGSDRLASIDEISTISDCSSTSSNSLPDPLSLSVDSRVQAMSTPRQRRAGRNNDSVLEGDSGFHRSSDMDDVLSQGNSSVDGALNDDFRTMSTSSEEPERHRGNASTASVSSLDEPQAKENEISASVMADIEDFQLFSKQKLAALGSNH